MPSELIFQEVKPGKPRHPYVLIRRPAEHTHDKMRTVGKLRPVMARKAHPRDPSVILNWRLELNGQDTLSMQEVSEVYLAMVGMHCG